MSLENEPLDIFSLSREAASFETHAYRLCSRKVSTKNTFGVVLECFWQGESIRLWLPEASWCHWIAPQLVSPDLATIPNDLHDPLANWTLSELNDCLEQLNFPPLTDASLSCDMPISSRGWEITIKHDERSLPVFFDVAPEELMDALLEVFIPDESRTISLNLSLGWTLISQQEWKNIQVGDALKIEGIDPALQRFWVNLPATPGCLTITQPGMAKVEFSTRPFDEQSHSSLFIHFEAAQATINAAQLAGWRHDAEFNLTIEPHPTLYLVSNRKRHAMGSLLKFEDGWMILIKGLNLANNDN